MNATCDKHAVKALLLTLTVTMYLVGRLPKPGSTLFAAARAIVQLSIAALVIAAVISSLWLSLLLLAFMFTIAVVTTVRRVEAPRAWPWATRPGPVSRRAAWWC